MAARSLTTTTTWNPRLVLTSRTPTGPLSICRCLALSDLRELPTETSQFIDRFEARLAKGSFRMHRNGPAVRLRAGW